VEAEKAGAASVGLVAMVLIIGTKREDMVWWRVGGAWVKLVSLLPKQ